MGGRPPRGEGAGFGAASYLTTYENYNDGWQATLGGRKLTPCTARRLAAGLADPAGAGGTVKVSYEPSTTYEAGLIGGGVGVAALAGLVLWRRREANPDAPQPTAPDAGLWLGTVALTLVGVVIAGPFALLVPALALLARETARAPRADRVPRAAGGNRRRHGRRVATGRGRGRVRARGAVAGVDRVVRGPGERPGARDPAGTPGVRPGPGPRFPGPDGTTPPTPPRQERRRRGGTGYGATTVGEAPDGEPGSSEPTGAEPLTPAPGPHPRLQPDHLRTRPGFRPARGGGAGDTRAG